MGGGREARLTLYSPLPSAASAQVKALGLSIGETVYSAITHENILPGYWGTVKGPATSSGADANQRVLVEWAEGKWVNYLRSQLRNEHEQVEEERRWYVSTGGRGGERTWEWDYW